MIGSNRFCRFGGWSGSDASRRDSGQAASSSGEVGGVGAAASGDSCGRWVARPARAEDFDAWDRLFAGYCDFYARPSTPEHRRQVWSWIEAGTIHCLVAVRAEEAAAPGGTTGPEADPGTEAGPKSEPEAPGSEPARTGAGGQQPDPVAAPEADATLTAASGPQVERDAVAGHPVGLAHVRPVLSPLRGAAVGFLDDLFIAPAARGSGAFECLVAAIGDHAATEGWPQVRWITAADNARARAAYDRVATKTDWVTYHLDV